MGAELGSQRGHMELQASVLLFPSTRLLPFWLNLSSPVDALLCQSRKACTSSIYSFLLVSSIEGKPYTNVIATACLSFFRVCRKPYKVNTHSSALERTPYICLLCSSRVTVV